jgi:hypothetical protein
VIALLQPRLPLPLHCARLPSRDACVYVPCRIYLTHLSHISQTGWRNASISHLECLSECTTSASTSTPLMTLTIPPKSSETDCYPSSTVVVPLSTIPAGRDARYLRHHTISNRKLHATAEAEPEAEARSTVAIFLCSLQQKHQVLATSELRPGDEWPENFSFGSHSTHFRA